MRDKSKFIGFILSFIPGLAHLYIGLKERAFIFLGMLGAGFLGSIFIGILAYGEMAVVLFVAGYSLLWLIALLDLFSAWKLVNRRYYENNPMGNPQTQYMNQEEIKENNKRTTALALSIVPGAGHMFLGYERKGLLIMGSFFFSIFFMGWLGISFLLFLLPLIWFYSFFDAMHIADGTKEESKDRDFELRNIKPEWIGYGCLGIGLIIIVERILYPLIDYRIRSYIQTSIVSLIFIIVGIWILNRNKSQENIETKGDGNNED